MQPSPATPWSLLTFLFLLAFPALASAQEDAEAPWENSAGLEQSGEHPGESPRDTLTDEESVPVAVEGRVLLPGGAPAVGAVVVSSAGGLAVVESDGSFRLEVQVAPEVRALELTAVASGPGGSLNGRGLVQGLTVGGTAPAGTLYVAKNQGCDPQWLPTFGGQPGVASQVSALEVFDDGSGPALYVGGQFTSAGGQAANRIARWDGSTWSALGTGLNDNVLALQVFDEGSGPALYVGGSFTGAGGQTANRIARWNGSAWSSLGTGQANGVSSQVLGASIYVEALEVFDDGSGPALYVGGRFPLAGGQTANHIARWNGSSWSSLGTGQANGLDNYVEALQVFDDGSGPALYAGGLFSLAGGQTANRIARWNGSAWSSLGTGASNGLNGSGAVPALEVFDDGSGPALYVGGSFTSAGGQPANRIARWNGSAWSSLGTGGANGLSSNVIALQAFDDGSGPALYVGGIFTSAGGQTANRIARWNGSAWSSLGTGGANGLNDVFATVRALELFNDGSGPALYVGGEFTSAGGQAANQIARWNGSAFSSLETGLDKRVYTLEVFDDGSGSALYVGGDFTSAGGQAASGIARWNGSAWSALGTGVGVPFASNLVLALKVWDDGSGPALYVGGEFTSAGGQLANRIARWDGSAWSSLGTGAANGLSGSVNALEVFDDGSGSALYVGGGFSSAGGQTANRIARWNGITWSPLGNGLSGGTFADPASVSALKVFNDGSGPALYAGGNFFFAGGQPANRIARWNGITWSTLGFGLSERALAIEVFNDGSGPALYVGGWFTSAGGQTANRIARWNGSAWSSLGTGGVNGLDSTVGALEVFDDGSGPALYVGGGFTSAGGQAANRIARWNGSAWSSLGTGGANGLNNGVVALQVFDDGSGPALVVGGAFSVSPAGDSYIAKWVGCPPPPVLVSREVSFGVGAPDLAVVEVKGPTLAEEGSDVQVFWRVRNWGTAVAQGPWSDRLWLSPTPQFAAATAIPLSTPGGGSQFPFPGSLQPGEDVLRGAIVVIPPGLGGLPAPFYLIAGTDQAKQVDEGGLIENNFGVGPTPLVVTKILRPDLVPGGNLGGVPTGPVISGTPLTIGFEVRNNGTGSTVGSWSDQLYLCKGPTFAGATLLASQGNVFGLTPGGLYPSQFQVNLPANIQGSNYYLGLLIDGPLGAGQQVESNESNNALFAGPFDITLQLQPDLVTQFVISIQGSITEGQPLSTGPGILQWGVSNVGAGPSTTGSWQEALYFSKTTDPAVGPDDVLLAVYTRSGTILGPSSSDGVHPAPGLDLKFAVPPGTVPAGLDQVVGYFKVRVDNNNAVIELDPPPSGEANNVAVSAPVELRKAPLPNLVAQSIQPTGSAIAGFPLSIQFSVAPTGGPSQGAYSFSWIDRIVLEAESGGATFPLGSYSQSNQPNATGQWLGVDYTKTVSSVIPATTPPGTYRLRLLVDAADQVAEVNELDNALLSAPFDVVFVPVDLAISLAKGAAPTSGAVQQTIPLKFTVTNLGPGKTIQGSWVDQVFLSADGITPIGAPIVSRTHSGALAAGQSYTAVTSGTLPALAPGSYSLLFRTDVNNAVPELEAANNVATQGFTLSPEAADLAVTSLLADRNAVEGKPLTVTWTVENQGTLATATSTWIDRIWLSTEPSLGQSAILLANHERSGAVSVGGSYSALRSVTIPFVGAGLRYLIIETDGFGQVFESNDQNNVSIRQILTIEGAAGPGTPGASTPPGLADLTVSQIAALGTSVFAGQPLQVAWTLQNVGVGPTNVADWVDRVYLSLDAVLDTEDVLLGFYAHEGFLPPDGSTQVTRSFGVPAKLAGSYFVIVETNGKKEVIETGTAANVAFGSQPVAVTLPLPADLVVEDVQVLGSWVVNQPAQIRYRVRNVGQNTVQGQWRDAVFLGTGTNVDGASVLLGQYTVVPPAPLAPGEAVLVERDLGKLPGVLPQDYRALVRADVLGQIPEPAGLDVNLGASPIFAVVVPLLGLGASGELELELASGQSAWFAMTPPAGATVRWTATHEAAGAWITLFASETEVPTPGTAQVSGLIPASATQALLIQGQGSPTLSWYGLVRASTGAPLGTKVRISAELVPLELTASVPAEVGAGSVTLRLVGEKLNAVNNPADVRLSLGNALGGTPVFGAQELLFDPVSGDLLARFALQGVPLGTYSLVVETADGTEVSALPGGIQVQAPTSGLVAVQVEPPAGVKKGNVGFAPVRIQNAGNVDLERGVVTLLLDPLQGSAAQAGLVWSALGLPSSTPGTNGLADSLVLFAPNLAPGQSAEAILRLDVPAGFPTNLATFGLTGRPLDGQGWYAPLAAPATSLLGRLSEALRQAVLTSEASPADLLALANGGGWNSVSNLAFAPYLGSSLQPAPKPQSLGAVLDALAAQIAASLPSGSAPPAAVMTSVRGQLACLVFEGTALPCQDLLAPPTCNLGVSAAPVQIGSGTNIPISAVCWPTPNSIDPNEKRNKPGFGPQQQVSVAAPIDYRVEFENIATAEASASFVEIFDPLQTGLDPSSFQLRTIRFGENVIEVPPGNSFYFGALDLTETAGVIVQVSAGLVFFDGQDDDRFAANGLRRPSGFEGTGAAVLWSLVAIDPATGLPPVSGLTGVLPPNSPKADGTGHVEFSTGLTPGPSSGTPVQNRAKIKFDAEPPLTTNQVTNTVDVKAPQTNLSGSLLPAGGAAGTAVAGSAQLSWDALDDDGGSGVLDHTVYVSVDDGPFEPFLVTTSLTATSYPVEFGRKYAFHVRTRDNTGQLEPAPLVPGFEVFVGNDCNGNGIDDALDLLNGTSFDCNFNAIPDECEPDSDGDGIIDACSTLSADVFSVSVSSGGMQRLSLQAGTQNANRSFLFVGSLSGSKPGVDIGSVLVPINIDAYTQYLLALPADSLLQPLTGQLDAQGRGRARVTVPAGALLAVQGLTLTHTYLLLDPVADFAARPVTLRLQP